MEHSLSVRNFSCIDSADIKLSAITVLIGPQASGKSVISKLTYFCVESINELTSGLFQELNLDAHKSSLASKFRDWFPVSAWGAGIFKIKYTYGKFIITIEKSRARKQPDKLNIKYSEVVEASYQEFYDIIVAAAIRSDDIKSSAARAAIETKNRVSREFGDYLNESVTAGSLRWGMFIPAGRSYFTSQFRAASVSKSSLLDPILYEFGQLYAYVREHGVMQKRPVGANQDSITVDTPIVKGLLGGTISLTKENAFLNTDDGRSLPFSFLSSGQQELLPLLLVLHVFKIGKAQSTYIEEPEAHLFPQSQSVLLEYLISLIDSKSESMQLFITTHSPYILARINNLITAGQIAASNGGINRDRVASVVPANSWIKPNVISAYAIENRSLINIIDDEGFVDAEWLDEVSNDIQREHARLLQIEFGNNLD